MPSASSDPRTLSARIAAHSRWALTADPAAATAPARQAFLNRFEQQVDPDLSLPPAERSRRAAHARKAYFTRLALKSAQARRKARDARSLAADLDAIAEHADADLANPDAAA